MTKLSRQCFDVVDNLRVKHPYKKLIFVLFGEVAFGTLEKPLLHLLHIVYTAAPNTTVFFGGGVRKCAAMYFVDYTAPMNVLYASNRFW